MTKDELVAFIKKNPVAVTCGVLSLALVVGLYFRSSEIPTMEAQLQEKSADAERYALNLTNAVQLKEQFDAVTAANKGIESRMIHASQLGANAQYFYRLETETGVKLLTDPRQTTPANVAKPAKGAFVPVAFTVSVEGTYLQLLEFLRSLENGAHYTRILTANCGVNVTKRSGPLTLTLTLELLGLP